MVNFTTNADGTTIGTFEEDAVVDGEPHNRITIPKLKGKHLFGAPPLNSIGMVLQWASNVVQPKGVLEEMAPGDAVQVGDFLFAKLNKRPPTGAERSASSEGTTAGAEPSSST